MSTSYMQAQFIIFIWMLSLGQCLISKFISQENDRVIIIDQDGTSDLECCMYGNCHCSNLSLALEHIQDNTEIRIQSGICLHNAVVFGNVSNVKITGDSNPTVRCDHQGGWVGKNINYIVIQGITWDSCNGITMLSFTHIHITECNFLNFALTLHGLGSVNIDGSKFSHYDDNADVLASSIIIYGSKFYSDSKSGCLVMNTTNVGDTLALHNIINVTVENCEFTGISEHCVHCIGSPGLLLNLSINSSNFANNASTAVNVEHCNITLNNVTFSNNTDINSGYINDPNLIVSSSPCSFSKLLNSTVYVNVTDINTTNNSLKFWLHDLHLAVIITNCSNNFLNTSFTFCGGTYNCSINKQFGGFTVTSKNAIVWCPNYNAISCYITYVLSNLSFSIISATYVTVQRFGHICDDIAHAYSEDVCLPICSQPSSFQQFHCVQQHILPGYWYDNGFKRFVASYPIGHYNQHFYVGYLLYTTNAIFPDRDSQCNGNWGGLACGECDYSAGYAIKYDTTECVPVDECLTTSVIYSLLILLGVSLLYWIVIISFIFVLLHFKFDITAGYAYGLLFYYSVLDQLVYDVTNHLSRNLETSYGYGTNVIDKDIDRDYEFMKLKVLPFLSSIGNLKPPFTGFMNLCFGKAKMIDHLMLGYIHPLIVTFLVIVVYILARNSVVVARTIGKYVINSKPTVCILLLLSYSSITYTSMQLLKPLPVFEDYGLYYSVIQVYWSPSIKYFHGRHLGYGIIAILCELLIGIGVPLVLIFQRYLIRYCNMNFKSFKPVIDQLKGCYKEEYRWFAAYYLICRQVLYGVNNLFDYCSGFWGSIDTTVETPFPKFTIVLITSIIIMEIHVWFQPYKSKSLNILDSFILSALVGLLVSSLEIFRNTMISVVFWFLPLLILINYFAYFTNLKHLIIPCSCAVLFGTAFYFPSFNSVFAILFLASSSFIFIIYSICVMKGLFARCHKTKPIFVAINEHNDERDEINESNITEVRPRIPVSFYDKHIPTT